MHGKIGFACKFIDAPSQVNGIKSTDACKKYNTTTTTIAWLNRQTRLVAVDKLWSIMQHNIESAYNLVQIVGDQEERKRMVRLSSDLLPAYTEPSWCHFWRQPDVVRYLEKNLRRVGDLARRQGVRLSFHPSQFCVLASHDDVIVDKSIDEFEYHADMARFMGFGDNFQDMKINVHISGRRGAEGFRATISRLSAEARNCITVENEEYSHGLLDCLTLSDVCPVVLDIHHHWCREGTYIQPTDPMVSMVIDSWRGTRPTMHYSTSREDLLQYHQADILPDMTDCLTRGFKVAKLRAHSDFYWNTAANEWALSFLDRFDIMCESKGKNLASFLLSDLAKQRGLV